MWQYLRDTATLSTSVHWPDCLVLSEKEKRSFLPTVGSELAIGCCGALQLYSSARCAALPIEKLHENKFKSNVCY